MSEQRKCCNKCLEEKPLSEFPKDKSKKDGSGYRCKVCNRAHSKVWRQSNPDRSKELSKSWRDENPERHKSTKQAWDQNNASKKTAISARRRASKLNATPSWLTAKHFTEIQSFYTLAKEREERTGDKYHVDHICPLQGENVCGLHVPWNLQVIPASENLAKSNKVF